MGSHPFSFAQQSQQQMLSACQFLLHSMCLGNCQLQNFFCARCVRKFSLGFDFTAEPDHTFHRNTNIVKRNSQFFQHLNRHTFT